MTLDGADVHVIYVHGSGPQPSPGELKHRLDAALFGSDQGSRTAVAYYADLLHPSGVAEIAAVALDVITRRPESTPRGADAVEEAFEYQAGAAMARRAESTRPEGLLPRVLRALLLRFVMRFFFRDAHRYFFESDAGPIRERVRELLSAQSGPVIVIGHSLGSIVAYDVMAEQRAPRVSLFVTVGSPMAIDAVKELVNQPPRVPDVVRAWLNAVDPLDIVAADPTFVDDYPPAERVRDVFVDNPSPSSHDFAAYLGTRPVRDAVRGALGAEASERR